MSKGTFKAKSGIVLSVTATEAAQGVEVDSDVERAIEANSNAGDMTISVTNSGAGAALATGCADGPGISASSHAAQGLVAISDLAEGILTFGVAASALSAQSMSHTALDAYSEGGVALAASSDYNSAISALSSSGHAIVGYGNPNASAAVFSNVTIQKRPGGGKTAYYQAADFIGNVSITGSFSVSGVKGFRIDHPLAPKKMWLHHAAVESDVMKNIYDGTVWLDDRGQSVVRLPKWFQALNKDFSYSLTAIGKPAPDLHISREISHNRFTIAGGNPNMTVSWQVTGIRKDAWASTYGFATEELKSEKERGHAICPTGSSSQRGLKAALSPNVYDRIIALDELKKNAAIQKQRYSAVKKQAQKRRLSF
jgi:hypothetical protein